MQLWVPLRPGSVIFINNERVLHGRRAFDSKSNRLLVGCYVASEEFHSKLRILSSAQTEHRNTRKDVPIPTSVRAESW
eukprot:m.850434 g.850434  ORF g.850434 m.850434 type:complete len:78 (+) comp59581_c0_seq4:1213-1446(+)